MPSAFISHSSPHDGYVAELNSLLCSVGYDVFNDVRCIKPDRQFWPKIQAGIRECDVFFVVITPTSMNSQWVKDEIAFADSLNKKVRPAWIGDYELPLRFADRDVIDFRTKYGVKSRKVASTQLEKTRCACCSVARRSWRR